MQSTLLAIVNPSVCPSVCMYVCGARSVSERIDMLSLIFCAVSVTLK